LSAKVSTIAPAESISATTSKENELKNGEFSESTDAVNESSVKSLKEIHNLKQHLVKKVEGVKLKIPKEDHSQSSNGDLLIKCNIK